jgi:aminoglycoside phosphotransferase (APT) family kinase protein
MTTAGKMHDHEVDTNTSLVRRLLATQFPQWADLPLKPVRSAGTVNALYRLGEDMVVRLPRIHWGIAEVDKELKWLPQLVPFLPLAIPVPLAKGHPGEGYPWPWSIYRWLEGETATIDDIADPKQAAIDLAQFITALQQIDTTGGPLAIDPNGRGIPLAMRDADTRKAIAALHSVIDVDEATRAWEAALQVSEWDRTPVWFHGDLLPGNLLFKRDRLSAVIDFGALGVGDPACDLMVAWSLFSGESRDVFRATLAVDDATWARGRGWALSVGLIALPYYQNTNPVFAGIAQRTINEALADYKAVCKLIGTDQSIGAVIRRL